MCGICGFYIRKNVNDKTDKEYMSLLSSMSEKIKHREPDGHGQWHNYSQGIFLDHRRLSIIDLSNNASQPMASKGDRWKIIFNGEIYNFLDLKDKISNKKKLSKSYWDGTGDTEVLIESINFFGIDKTLELIDGMFAFALWDSEKNELTIARDRVGEKPLYYFDNGVDFIFASDIQAIREYFVNKDFNLDLNSVKELCKYNFVPSPNTIYKDIKKLEPGNYFTIKPDTKDEIKKNKYWDKNSFSSNINSDVNKLPNQIENLLFTALEKIIIADVPIGLYLSGGVDSTLLAILLKEIKGDKVDTFTIRNKDNNFDESIIAKKTSSKLNFNHHEFEINQNDLLELIEKLSDVYTEPFADSSQLPTLLLNSKAKNYIKVALGGDGGDELFGGYNRYYLLDKYFFKIQKIPLYLRNKISRIMLGINSKHVDFFFNILNKVSSGLIDYKNFGYKIQKIAFSIIQKNDLDLYDNLLSSTPEIDKSFIKFNFDIKRNKLNFIKDNSFIESMMLTDLNFYLPDDILCKVDRASMWNGLEVRSPFLDRNLVEFCLNIPTNIKFRNNENKWILRSIIKKYFSTYNNKSKMGFSSPIDSWLRFEIKKLFISNLDKKFIDSQGIFNYEFVLQKWNEHLNGKRNWGKYLWSFLIFQKWYKKNY